MNASIVKRVSDPVHGSIGLTDLETRVIETRAFQRLRYVKHLGLVYLVFPGADFSRFSHSLGTCHVMGRLLDALFRSGLSLKCWDRQRFRLAALLHDIGHYPFSHAMEDAVSNHYTGRYVVADGEDRPLNLEQERPFNHERAGKEVLLGDEELRSILKEEGYDPEDISSIFMREEHEPNQRRLASLLSSDLDADRIDYLLRTAHHTGLPYGAVDLDYILSQLLVDADGRICLSRKALRAVDHFLLSRYFDYLQVAYHKTVVAFELLLKDVLAALLRNGLIECSAGWVGQAIRNGEWSSFDDTYVWGKIRELSLTASDEVDKLKAKAILDRRPPKLVWASEFLGSRDDHGEHFKLQGKMVRSVISDLAKQFDVPRSLWLEWEADLKLTKMGPHMSVSKAVHLEEDDEDGLEQTVHILDTQGSASQPIVSVRQSLMNILANYVLYARRIYVILPEGEEGRYEEIKSAAQEHLG